MLAARVWLNGGSVVMKLFVNWRSRDQSHPGLPVSHVLRRVWAPRVIVVAGMDPWTPCHASTSPAPVADSPSQKKKTLFFLRMVMKICCHMFKYELHISIKL